MNDAEAKEFDDLILAISEIFGIEDRQDAIELFTPLVDLENEIIPMLQSHMKTVLRTDFFGGDMKASEAFEAVFQNMPSTAAVSRRYGPNSEITEKYAQALEQVEANQPKQFDDLVLEDGDNTKNTNSIHVISLTRYLDLLADNDTWLDYWEKHKIPRATGGSPTKRVGTRPLDLTRLEHVLVTCVRGKARYKQMHANGVWYKIAASDQVMLLDNDSIRIATEKCSLQSDTKPKKIPWKDIPLSFWETGKAIWYARTLMDIWYDNSIRKHMRFLIQQHRDDKTQKLFLNRMFLLRLKTIYCLQQDCPAVAEQFRQRLEAVRTKKHITKLVKEFQRAEKKAEQDANKREKELRREEKKAKQEAAKIAKLVKEFQQEEKKAEREANKREKELQRKAKKSTVSSKKKKSTASKKKKSTASKKKKSTASKKKKSTASKKTKSTASKKKKSTASKKTKSTASKKKKSTASKKKKSTANKKKKSTTKKTGRKASKKHNE